MIESNTWLIASRQNAGLTQQQLADASGVAPSTIRNIEQGQRTGSIETWRRIKLALLDNSEDIANIRKTIKTYGENHTCYLTYFFSDKGIIFESYYLNKLDINSDKYLKTTLKDALEIFNLQLEIKK